MSKPKSKMLTLPAFVAKNGVGTFLEPKDLCAVAQTCRQNRDLYKHNCKASELLFYGLNINKVRKKKLLELLEAQKSNSGLWQKFLSYINLSQNPEAQSVILTRVNGRQVYFSKKLKGIACIRIVANLSPLEAAALCGDFPLVRLLLENLPDNQNKEAVLQLKRIREKLDSDSRSFVSLISSLQKAYKEFLDNCKSLEAFKNWGELNRLSGLIGENQKALSWFLLQVFCRRVPHEPFPDFSQEPDRECIVNDDRELNLDIICANMFTLFKGSTKVTRFEAAADEIDCWAFTWWQQFAFEDSKALDGLCAVIKSELDQIIKLQEQKLLLAEYPNPEQPTSTPTCDQMFLFSAV